MLEDHGGWAEEALALGYFEALVGFSRVSDDLNLLAFSKELSFGERRSNEVTWPLLGIRLVEAQFPYVINCHLLLMLLGYLMILPLEIRT